MRPNHRMEGKLDARWNGPYTVAAKLSKGSYQLQSKNGVVLKKLYNSCLLKEYYETGIHSVRALLCVTMYTEACTKQMLAVLDHHFLSIVAKLNQIRFMTLVCCKYC